eukprot:3489161-Pyramimonas_sp.AAC.1
MPQPAHHGAAALLRRPWAQPEPAFGVAVLQRGGSARRRAQYGHVRTPPEHPGHTIRTPPSHHLNTPVTPSEHPRHTT